MPPMDDAEVYQEYPHLIHLLAGVCKGLTWLPLAQMAETNERMQTLAPMFLPPVDYHAGATNLADQRRVIDAAKALQDVLYSVTGAPPRPD